MPSGSDDIFADSDDSDDEVPSHQAAAAAKPAGRPGANSSTPKAAEPPSAAANGTRSGAEQIKNSLKRPATDEAPERLRDSDEKQQPTAPEAKAAKTDDTKAARSAPSSSSAVPQTIVTEIQCAASEDRGRRTEFEDRAVAVPDGRAEKTAPARVSFYAVLDGHAGRRAADFAAEHLHEHALGAGLVPGDFAHGKGPLELSAVKAAVVEAFERTDRALLAEATKGGGWQDGAAAACVWALGERVVVANVGDVKAVLARRQEDAGGIKALKAITLSKEHKAIHAAERARIEKAGGSVHNGRLSGRLEVSRSFGDASFKRIGASATPNVISFELAARDEFMLVACDGFWNLWSADGAVETAAGLLEERGGEDGGLKAVTNRLLNITVRERRCKDNCTVMLLRFSRR